MVWFEILERIIGHIAWPLAAYLIVRQFSDEVKLLFKKVKTAKIKGVELDLSHEIESIKDEAESAGITIVYPSGSFPADSIKSIEAAPEWAFIQSWQDISNVLKKIQSEKYPDLAHRSTSAQLIEKLFQDDLIDDAMKNLLSKLRKVRNDLVHSSNPAITRGEALEWLGISKSVKDRLIQRLTPEPVGNPST